MSGAANQGAALRVILFVWHYRQATASPVER